MPLDLEFAKELRASLQSQNLKIVMQDVSEPEGLHNLDDAQTGLILLSPNSFDAKEMENAVSQADYKDIHLYTVRLEEAPLGTNLGFFLKWSQWLDLAPGAAAEDLDFLAQTIKGGKALDRSKRPQNRRARRKKISIFLGIFALLVGIISVVTLLNSAKSAREAERLALEREEMLKLPPGDVSIGYSVEGSNPWVPALRMTVYLIGFAQQRLDVEVGLYRRVEAGSAWEKVAQYSGPTTRDAGTERVELVSIDPPVGARMCLIYGNDVGNGLLRRQYALYDIEGSAEAPNVQLVEADLPNTVSATCDDLFGASPDESSLQKALNHERLLQISETQGYEAPKNVVVERAGGIRIISGIEGTLLSGNIPGAELFVYSRDEAEAEWAPLARIRASSSGGYLDGFSPNQVLVCADTRIPGQNAHIVTQIIAEKVSTTSYEIMQQNTPSLTYQSSPCTASGPSNPQFPIDETRRVLPATSILPENSGFDDNSFVRIGDLQLGDEWEASIKNANILLGMNATEMSGREFERLTYSDSRAVLRALIDDVEPTSILYLGSGDGLRRGVALVRNNEQLAGIVYVFRPAVQSWPSQSRWFSRSAWNTTLEAQFGSEIELRGSGTERNGMSGGSWMWPTFPEKCSDPLLRNALFLYSTLEPAPCLSPAGAAMERFGSNLAFIIWSGASESGFQ